MNTITCPNCAAPAPAGAAFCDNCGASLTGAAAGVAADSGRCPNCGASVQPSDMFCDNCGQALMPSGYPSEPQIPAQSAGDPAQSIARPQPPVPALSVVSPRLVVQSSGVTLNLAPAKNDYLIGREDPVSGSFPDVDLVPYGGEEGGVSRRHAQIVRRGVQFTIEDLNSVNYTFINRQKIAPGTPHPLNDGDEIRLGRVVLQFRSG
jgi:pSer/pThr/pTyr-binding forkhead associated (FHA) protein